MKHYKNIQTCLALFYLGYFLLILAGSAYTIFFSVDQSLPSISFTPGTEEFYASAEKSSSPAMISEKRILGSWFYQVDFATPIQEYPSWKEVSQLDRIHHFPKPRLYQEPLVSVQGLKEILAEALLGPKPKAPEKPWLSSERIPGLAENMSTQELLRTFSSLCYWRMTKSQEFLGMHLGPQDLYFNSPREVKFYLDFLPPHSEALRTQLPLEENLKDQPAEKQEQASVWGQLEKIMDKASLLPSSEKQEKTSLLPFSANVNPPPPIQEKLVTTAEVLAPMPPDALAGAIYTMSDEEWADIPGTVKQKTTIYLNWRASSRPVTDTPKENFLYHLMGRKLGLE